MIERQTRLRIDASGHYGRVYDRQVGGCDSEFDRSQIHQQFGGSVGAQFEHESGVNAGSELSFIAGSLSEQRGIDEPVAEDYFMGGLVLYGGYDFRYFGFDLGMLSGFGEGQTAALPLATMRFGKLGEMWGEFGVVDPHFQPLRMAHASFRVRQDLFELRAGLALRTMWMIDLYDGEIRTSHSDDEWQSGSVFVEYAQGPYDGWGAKLSLDLTPKSPHVLIGVYFQPNLGVSSQ
jgi:hypothetical protein